MDWWTFSGAAVGILLLMAVGFAVLLAADTRHDI